MACEMSAQFAARRLPSTQGHGMGGNAGIDAEILNDPVDVQTQQVFPVSFEQVFHRSVEKPDLTKVKRDDFDNGVSARVLYILAKDNIPNRKRAKDNKWQENLHPHVNLILASEMEESWPL
jgi:hypothetical protein